MEMVEEEEEEEEALSLKAVLATELPLPDPWTFRRDSRRAMEVAAVVAVEDRPLLPQRPFSSPSCRRRIAGRRRLPVRHVAAAAPWVAAPFRPRRHRR